jgi:DNA-binding transcriptional MerR regulator/effector-binding domain-containing protein
MSAALPVGEFSRMTHLSVKTLRHYHQVGLLDPARVDESTGYRYYSPDQVPRAQVIRRLRDLDMPVAEVKAVLLASDAAERNQLIAAHLDRLEGELARTTAAVNSLRGLLERPRSSESVEHRTVAAVRAIAIVDVVDRDDILDWWQGALGELHATVSGQHLRARGPSGGLFANQIFADDRGEATVFIPVEGSIRPVGRVIEMTVPPAELAVMPHRGSLADVDVTYGALGTYANSNEISVDGPLREYYILDASNSRSADEWLTEICWPIFRADGGS